MVVVCLIPLALVFGVVWFFGVRAGNWGILLVLLCPLMHVFMMGAHGHGQDRGHGHGPADGGKGLDSSQGGHDHTHDAAPPQVAEPPTRVLTDGHGSGGRAQPGEVVD